MFVSDVTVCDLFKIITYANHNFPHSLLDCWRDWRKNILVSPSAVSLFWIEILELEIEKFVVFHTWAQPHFRILHEALGTTETSAGNCCSTG